MVSKRQISSPRRESNTDHPIIQPVASRYTDWAIAALQDFFNSSKKKKNNQYQILQCTQEVSECPSSQPPRSVTSECLFIAACSFYTWWMTSCWRQSHVFVVTSHSAHWSFIQQSTALFGTVCIQANSNNFVANLNSSKFSTPDHQRDRSAGLPGWVNIAPLLFINRLADSLLNGTAIKPNIIQG
jgi:hypothetical protein